MLRSLDDTTAHLTARHTRQQLREINHELGLAMGYQRKIRISPVGISVSENRLGKIPQAGGGRGKRTKHGAFSLAQQRM